jgi:dihydrofolate reductase
MIRSVIVAQSENRTIGINNTLPWHIPADLKRFKSITMGHCIIMGRKTYDSIGKPLPGRTNIVVTRNKSFKIDGCVIVHSLEEAYEYALKINETESFVIGGAELIKQAISDCDKIYLTIIHSTIEGDTFLDPLSNDWKIESTENYLPDEKNNYHYSFINYIKNT